MKGRKPLPPRARSGGSADLCANKIGSARGSDREMNFAFLAEYGVNKNSFFVEESWCKLFVLKRKARVR